MDTENEYDTIPSSPTDIHKQHIYIQVSIPDFNMKVSLATLHCSLKPRVYSCC